MDLLLVFTLLNLSWSYEDTICIIGLCFCEQFLTYNMYTYIHIYIVGGVFIMSVLAAVCCEPLWSFILYSVIKVKATCLWLGTSVTVACVKVLAFLGMFWYCDQSNCIWSGCGRLCHALLNSVSFYFRVGKGRGCVRTVCVPCCKEDTEYQPFAFVVWNPALILYSIIIKSILTVMPYH